MCEFSTIGLIASLASSVIGGFGQYQQQKAQAEAARAAANYNAQVAANEAETQRNLALAEMRKGADERNRVIRAGLARQGEMAAGLGASGFTLDQGANLSLLGQGAEEVQHDASIVGQNTAMNAWSRLAGANRAENDAAFNRYQASVASKSVSPLGLAGTVLGSIGQGLTGYYRTRETKKP